MIELNGLRRSRLERTFEMMKTAQVRCTDFLTQLARDDRGDRDAVLAELLVDAATYAKVSADLVEWAIGRLDPESDVIEAIPVRTEDGVEDLLPVEVV